MFKRRVVFKELDFPFSFLGHSVVLTIAASSDKICENYMLLAIISERLSACTPVSITVTIRGLLHPRSSTPSWMPVCYVGTLDRKGEAGWRYHPLPPPSYAPTRLGLNRTRAVEQEGFVLIARAAWLGCPFPCCTGTS